MVLGDTTALGTGPVANVTAYATNSPWGVSQGIAVGAFGLTRGVTYSVVLTGETQTVLGTLKSSWFFDLGGFLLSTRHGDTIPGGNVGALAGRTIEVRDGSGVAVLTGAFPSLR